MEKVKLLAAFLAGALITAALMFYFAPKPEKELPLPPEAELTATTNTNVSYTTKTSADDPDAEITVHAPAVKIKYNDSAYTLPALKNEQHKFDAGKLTVETKTETALDVTNSLTSWLRQKDRARQWASGRPLMGRHLATDILLQKTRNLQSWPLSRTPKNMQLLALK